MAKTAIAVIFAVAVFCLAVFSFAFLAPESQDSASAASARWLKNGVSHSVSACTPGGVTVLAGTNTSELSASDFYLYADSGSASDFKWMDESAFGYQDFDCGSDKAFVYYLQYTFSGNLLTAVQQNRVSVYFYCQSCFDDGINDESGAFFQEILPSDATPTNAWVSDSRGGSDASWSTTTNARHAPGWSNDDGNRTVSWGEEAYNTSYRISTTATGVRLVFGAISDSKLDGGFKNIKLKFYTNLSNTVTVNNASYGSVSPTSVTASTSGASTTATATPNNGYSMTSWTKTGFVSTPSSTASGNTGTITISASNMGASSVATANFTPITYTIKYDNHGVTNAALPAQKTVTGTATSAALGAASATGFTFLGWTTDPSATTATYNASSTIIGYNINNSHPVSAAIDLTFYAIWQMPTSNSSDSGLTASPHPIYALSSGTYQIYDDVAFSITANKTGQSLVGVYAHYTSGDLEGVDISLEQRTISGSTYWVLYGICGNCTLYGDWIANRYSVTYSANGGSGSVSTEYYYYGTSHALNLTSITRSNYYLAGYRLSNGSGYTSSTNYYAIPKGASGNLTATAQWTTNQTTCSDTSSPSIDTTGISDNRFDGNTTGLGTTKDAGQNSQGSWADLTAATKSITIPTYVQNLLRAGATVTATISGTLKVGAYNDNYVIAFSDPDGMKARGRMGINSAYSGYAETGWTSVYDLNSDVKYAESSLSATSSSLSSSATTVTVYVQLSWKKDSKRGTGKAYALLPNWRITYSISGSYPVSSLTYSSDGGTSSASESSVLSTGWGSASSVDSTLYLFKKTGYRQTGWSSRTATYTAKNYPLVTYDVYYDGTNYATEIRKEYYCVHNKQIDFNGNSASASAYSNPSSYTNLYPYSGGNDYAGFTRGTVGGSTKPQYTISRPANSRQYASTGEGTSVNNTNSVTAASVTGAVWGYYLWTMDAPMSTFTNISVLYGNTINLENQITPAHGDTTATFSVTTWKESNVAGTPTHTFYITGQPILYAVSESHEYSCTLEATVYRAGVALHKSSTPSGLSATITPIKLKLNAPTGGAASLTYNGTIQDFLFTTTVDSTQHTGAELTAAQNVFARERDIGEHGTGLPHYYSASGANSGFWCGVSIQLVGLGYTSALGSSYYEQAGSNVFRDAGTYWVSLIKIKQYLASVQASDNQNYVWTSSSSQTITANAVGDSGTVSATINPITTGVELYAFYVYKTFGQYADPGTIAVNMDAEGYDATGGVPNFTTYPQTSWYLGIKGLLPTDYEAYSASIKSGLTRAKAGLFNQAGTYDVTVTMNSATFAPQLLNNYGCAVNAVDYSVLTTSRITMYFYNAAGAKISNTGFDFTTAWNLYAQSHNNFAIKPRQVTVTYSGDTSFTYNGTAQGPTNVISDGLLDSAGQNTYKFLPVASATGNPHSLGYYELSNDEYVVTEDTTVNALKTYYERSTSYDDYFELYFYGIPMPSNWASLSSSGKATYVTAHLGEKAIVGSGARNYVSDVSTNWIQFLETNAGSYGVVLVGTAFSNDDGETFYSNPDYVLSDYFGFAWTIAKVTVTANSSVTSGTFGDTNFGGTGFLFSGILAGDAITCTVTTTRNGASSTGFIRYQGFTSSTEIVNGTYRIYGTHVGTYVTTITSPVTVGSTASSGLYGASYGNNYQFSSASYTSTLEIVYRTIGQAVTYTVDNGTNYVNAKPNGTYDWVYQYGVSKGVKIVLSGFYTSGFATDDVSYYGGGKSAAELAKILIPSVTTTIGGESVEGLLDAGKITVSKTLSSTPAPTETYTSSITGTGSVTYTFLGVNANSSPYTIGFSVSAFTYTYNSVEYANFHLSAAINESFTVSPKVLNVSWVLDEAAVSALDPSVTYDATSHTVTASLTRGTNTGTPATDLAPNDGKVYYSDYISASSLYTAYSASGSVTLSYTGDRTKTNAGSYSAYVTQLSGNYTIAETASSYTSRQLDWSIARRTFTMSVSSPGLSYLYDGTRKTATLSLNGSGVTVTIDDFTTNVSGVAGVHFTTSAGLSFSASDKTFGAVDVGQYEFSYNAGSGIDVETNWRLTGSASYTSSGTYLFVICPKVLVFAWNTTSLVYNGTNRVADFNPSYASALDHTGLSLTYSLSDITHADTYTQAVTGASGNGNFVLGAAGLSSAWYATYNDNERLSYYTTNCVANGNALNTYSQSVTLQPYTITLNTASLNAELTNYVYDGTTHGHSLADLYTASVQSSLLTAADRSGYSLAGTSATGSNAGNYAVSITGFNAYAGHTDYVLAAAYNNTWSITPKPLTFLYTEYHEYAAVASPTGNPHTQPYYEKRYSLTGDVIESSGKTYFTYAAGAYSPVVVPNNGNPHDLGYYEEVYEISSDTSVDGSKTYYVVGAFSAGTPPTIAYDGLRHGYSFSISGMVPGEKITLSFTHDNTSMGERTSFKISSSGASILYGVAAQSYTFRISGISNAVVGDVTYLAANYSIPENGTADKTWAIERRTIAVSWHNESLTYRASEYNTGNGGCYATVTNLVGSDTFTLTYGGTTAATNAGANYPISVTAISGGSSSNYQIVGSLSTTWTIAPKAITLVTWAGNGFAGTSVTYDGTAHNVVATPTSGASAAGDGKIYDGDAATFAFSYLSSSPYVESVTVAGTYQSKISASQNTNYTIDVSQSYATTTWYVTQRTITASVTYDGGVTSYTYDHASHGVTVTLSGFVATDYSSNVSFSFTFNTTDNSAGGTTSSTVYARTFKAVNHSASAYTVSVSLTGTRAACYALSGTTSGSFTIVARPVTLSWALSGVGGFTAVYDGVAHVLSATVSNLADEGDVVNVTVSNGTQTNVGSYTGTASALSNANYTLTGGANLSQTYSITARPITAAWSSNSYTYNGTYQSNALTLYNLIAADSLTFTVNFYTGGYSGTNIHTSSVTKTGGTSATISATELAATIDVGTYYAILATDVKTGGVTNANYSFTPANESDRCTYEIGRKTMTLSGVWTWANGGNSGSYTNSTHLIYNKTEYTLTTAIAGGAACTRSDTGVADTLGLTYSGNTATHASASETATVSGITGTYAGNYVLPAEISRSYVIYAKEVTVVWANYSGIVYDGAFHTVTASIASGATTSTDGKAYTGDTVVVTTISNATQKNVASYTSVASALGNPDYVIGTGEYASGNATLNWSIAARPVSMTWSPTNVQYDGTEKTVTATVSNRIEGDVLTFTYSNNAKTVVGDYTASVTALGGEASSNYTLTGGTNLSHVWHITPVVLSFSWSGGANLVYNKTAQGVLLTIDNIASADLDDTDKLSFTTGGGVTATHDESVYTITFTAIGAGSYTASVTAITGTSRANYSLPDNTSTPFTVAQRVITVSWTYSDVVYDSASHNAVASVTNLCAGDSTTLSYRTVGAGTSYNVLGAAGTGNVATHADSYTTSVTAVSNADYTISGATGLGQNWTISAKPLTAFTFLFDGAAPTTITYDGAAKAVTATVTSAATATNDGKTYTGDSVTLGYAGSVLTNYGISAISGNSATNAGVYRVSVVSTGNSDYSVAGIYVDVTIAKRTLTVTINDVTSTSFVYNGSGQGKRVTLGNIVAGDNDNTNLNVVPAVYSIVANPVAGDLASYYEITAYALTSDVAINASKRYYTESAGVYSYVSAPVVGSIGSYYEPSAYALTEDVAIGAKEYFSVLSLSSASRASTTLSRDVTAINAGSYNGAATLSGSRHYNYQLASAANIHFTIAPKTINTAIVANTTTDTFTYAARTIRPSDLGISFTTLVGGETLAAGTDFNVSYKQNGSPVATPSSVGSYTAVISLAGTTTANNYTLVGTTEFDFSIVKYLIPSSALSWKIGATPVTLNGMVYAANTNKTIELVVTDAIYNTVVGKTLTYRYFGFCNGALNQSYAEFTADSDHASHQWLLDNGDFRTTGPVHAGTYWVVVTLSSADAANFRFDDDYFTGYADANHFTTSSGNTYLTWYNDASHRAIATPLPVLGDNVACITFGINRLALGGEVAATASSLPYKGAYYTVGAHYKATGAFSATKTYYTGSFSPASFPANASLAAYFLTTYVYYESDNGDYVLTEDTVVDAGKTYYTGTFTLVENPVAANLGTYYEYYGLPYVSTVGEAAEILVEIDSTLYTYEDYKSGNFIKNAGTYNIRIYDANADGAGTVSGCDFFSDGAQFSVDTDLTVSQAVITVTDSRTDANAWKKKYDKTVDFPAVINAGTPGEETIYSYSTGVVFADGTITDGVLSGTTVTVSAAYDNYNSGARTLTFTLGGADASNYKIAFATSENDVDEEDVTVSGNTYSLDGYILQRVITVVNGSATKVYDGTNALVPFVIDSSDILASDEGTVTVQGYFASSNVGENIGITVTIVNDPNNNYTLAGVSVAATGTITAKPISFNWVNTGNVTYDRSAHGVTVTVVGMVADHEEVVTVIGSGISDTTIAAGTTSATYTATAAGTYSVSLSLAAGASSNYSIAAATTFAEWTIAQKEVAVAWTKDTLADGAYVYGWTSYSVVYSAVERSVTPSVSGIIAGDTVTFTTQQTAATNVGNYSSAVTALTGTDAGNYALPAVTAQAWSITAATITGVTISPVNGVYNAAPQGPEVNRYTTQHGISLNAVYSGGVNKTRDTLVGNNARTAVGSSSVSVSLSAANYTTLVLNTSVTITQATVTGVLLADVNTTYDTTAKTVAVNRTVTQYGETVTVTYQISDDNETFVSGNSKTNAGTYYVRASCTAGGNYVDFVLNATLTIAKADITRSRITVTDDSGTITYDAAYHGVTITVTDDETQYGEPVTITYYGGEVGGTAKNVGTYHINAVVSAGTNYNDFTTESTTLTITAKSVTLTYQSATFTYNGAIQTPTVTIASGVCAADVGSVSLSVGVLGTSGEADGDTIFKDAGTYRLTPTLNSANYVIPAGANSSYKDYTVNQATVTGYYFVGNTVAYNGEMRYLGVYSDNVAYMNNVTTVALLASDQGTVTYKYNTTAIDAAYNDAFTGAKYAGTYYIQATISLNGNYAAWSRTATLTINSVSLVGYSLNDVVTTFDGSVKTLAVTVDDGSLYNAGVYSTPQGDVLTLTYAISSDAGGSYVAGNSATNVLILSSAVAAYRVRLTFTLAAEATASYVAGSLILNATLTINKANLSGISFPGGTYTYDGNAHNVTPSVSPAGEGYPRYSLNGANTVMTVILSASHNGGSGDTFTVTQSVDEGVSAINVGSYNFRLGITPLSANANNYVTFAGLVSTVTITAATMSTSAGAALVQNTNVYFGNGALSFSYDAVYHYLILATSSVSSVLTTNAGSLVSSFTVYPSGNTEHSDVAEVVYSVNGTAESGVKNVGVYTITATLQNGNYVSVPLTASVTITKANIPYYFVGKTDLVYDTLTHYAAVSTTDAYLNNGTVTQIDLQGSDKATVAYTYTSVRNGSGAFSGATNADTYSVTATITVSGGMGGNYNTWETNNAKTVSLVIAPYSTSVVWVNHDSTFTYNGASFAGIISASFTAANSVTTAMTITYLGTSGKATGDTDIKNAGAYTVTATYVSATAYNYNFTTATTQSVTVNKANVTLYLVNASATYNGVIRYLAVNTVNASNVTTSNVTSVTPFASDVIPILYTYAKAGGTYDSYYDGSATQTLTTGARNAGTYTVTADIDLGEGEVNYNDWATPLSATFTIDKVVLTQSGGVFSKEYDGATTIADFGSLSGIVSADSAFLTANGAYNNKNVGTGKNIVFGLTPAEHYAYLVDNYILPTSITGTIIARALTVPTTLEYWQKAYDGRTGSTRNPLSITTDNRLVAGDTITVNAAYNSKNVLSANTVSFTILGVDAANYSLAALDFSSYVDFSTIYLILPLSAGIVWSTDEADYNGRVQALSATVDVYGDDADDNSGTISLPVTLTRTHDGNGTTLSPAESNATYRNAGTYQATATAGNDADFVANYGISSTVHTYVIHKATRGVNWSGLAASYTYNGADQGAGIVASVTLLGTDVTTYAETDYLTVAVTKNASPALFKDAGDYTLTASLTVAELLNNYTLSNSVYERTIQKANINNVAFTGSYSWTYYSGVTDYFFVVSSGGTYARYESGAFSITTSFNYPFDATPMPIEYGGGEYSHANVTGNNGIKNAGSYTITASVASTTNYNAWSGSITVTVSKGTIDNIVMGDVTKTYGSTEYYLYAYNGTVGDGSDGIDAFETVTTPDGEPVTVAYSIGINEYRYADYSASYDYTGRNYAVNAGVYAVGGSILNHRNYNDYTIPNVVASSGTGAILDIRQRDAAITWEYNNQAVADFTYDATNQAAKVRARIIRIEGGAHNYYLTVAFTLDDEIDVAAALQTEFVVAGDYDLVASVPNTTPAEQAEYPLIRNNYNITGTDASVTMKKFTVAIQWHYMTNHAGGDPEIYDIENPCVYDKTTHGVTATGLGLNSVVMQIDTSGVFQAINAGNYTASVDDIHEGTDTLVLGGNTYYLPYSMNYQLADATLNWKIARRPVSLTLDTEHSAFTKVYDNSAAFTLGLPTVLSTPQLDGTVVLTWTYHQPANEADQDYTVIYSINNIIAADSAGITLPVSSITASTENVTADCVTIVFDELALDGNYIIVSDLSGAVITGDDIITPRDVELVFAEDASHVYNGETFSLVYVYADGVNAGIDGLFALRNPSSLSPISSLLGTNRIVGTANIGGETDAGTYDIVASLSTKDANNVTNYNLTIDGDTDTYEILRRRLEVTYTGLLQSLQQAFSHVTCAIDNAGSDLTDLDWAGMAGTPVQNLAALLTADSFAVTVGTAWESETYEAYTRIVGSSDSGLLPVVISSDNYEINYPVLQITYLKVASSYSFLIENLNDLLHLDTDNFGLAQTYDTYEVGSLPTFTQTADISGLVDGEYTVLPSVRSFRGNYVGGNHALSHLIVLPNSLSEDQERYYFGFFNRIADGSVRNLNLYDISAYSTGTPYAVGAFAGAIESGVTVENVVLNFTLAATASYSGATTTAVGGFVGALRGTLSSVTAVGKSTLNVGAFTELYYGGVIGYAYGGSANTITSFVDSSVISSVSLASDFYHGAVVGGKEEDWEDALTTYSYLHSSDYVYDGVAGTATLGNSAFGDEADTTHAASYDTLHGNATVGAILDAYVLRSYLFADGCTGLTGAPVVLTNYRQIPLLIAYPYLSFRLASDVYTPIGATTYHRGFYGAISYTGGAEFSATLPSDINLLDAIKANATWIVIKKEEE